MTGALLTASVAAAPAGSAAVGGQALAVLDAMTLDQQVGEVFMVGTPATGIDPATAADIRDRHVGGVILTGRSTAGVAATAGLTGRLQALVPPRHDLTDTGLLVAADQEGGAVQVLSGPGFSDIPSALVQGTRTPSVLRTDAAAWGRQLRSAGVQVDLAPVLGTVPGPQAARSNPPIGAFDREYGYTPATVAGHGTAVVLGMADGGVAATGKHFPGLGRVPGNTDTTAGVTDTVTTRHDAYLQPFAEAVRQGVPLMMVGTADYALIDPGRPAAFSVPIVTGMLRDDLGFRGVVMSDDLGNAAQVAAWAPGDRAVAFLRAGGDLVLTVNPSVLPAMDDAVLSLARTDAGFRARVREAALRVLDLKRAQGLLPPSPGPRYLLGDSLGGVADHTFVYGDADDLTYVGDWNGDGHDTPAVRRGLTFYVRDSLTSGPADEVFSYGDVGDQVLIGDWNGDGRDTPAVRRGNTFYVRTSDTSGTADETFAYGDPGDEVLVGDWDGDGRDTLAVRRGFTLYVRNSNTTGGADGVYTYGDPGDEVLVGDWNGDGRDTLAVRRANTYYAQDDLRSTTADRVFGYGDPADTVLVGDWNGDGSDTLGVRRPLS